MSAGSNPAGGTGQRHKFEHPNNLDASQPWVCDLRLRNGAVMFAPRALPEWPPLLLLRRSWHIAISAYEAVALLSQVGTPSPTQREHNGLVSTAYMRLPNRSAVRLWPPCGWPRTERPDLHPFAQHEHRREGTLINRSVVPDGVRARAAADSALGAPGCSKRGAVDVARREALLLARSQAYSRSNSAKGGPSCPSR